MIEENHCKNFVSGMLKIILQEEGTIVQQMIKTITEKMRYEVSDKELNEFLKRI